MKNDKTIWWILAGLAAYYYLSQNQTFTAAPTVSSSPLGPPMSLFTDTPAGTISATAYGPPAPGTPSGASGSW